jgi:hypothetical protein
MMLFLNEPVVLLVHSANCDINPIVSTVSIGSGMLLHVRPGDDRTARDIPCTLPPGWELSLHAIDVAKHGLVQIHHSFLSLILHVLRVKSCFWLHEKASVSVRKERSQP